ncbi:hypothetical protein GHT09_016216 [Marmota monax]|uniref:Uncharacterized protein n=1 Tax=Marmota monax TaxID=9995 RepID=A0A834UUH3_MARMO|nr:hypothetical protein GHT09_016216 [Marmota monax]
MEVKARERAKGSEWSKRVRKDREEAGGEMEGARVGWRGQEESGSSSSGDQSCSGRIPSRVPGFLAWLLCCPPPTSACLDAPELALPTLFLHFPRTPPQPMPPGSPG